MANANQSNSSSLNLILAGALVSIAVFVAITLVTMRSRADELDTTLQITNSEPTIGAITYYKHEEGSEIHATNGYTPYTPTDDVVDGLSAGQTPIHARFTVTDLNGSEDILGTGENTPGGTLTAYAFNPAVISSPTTHRACGAATISATVWDSTASSYAADTNVAWDGAVYNNANAITTNGGNTEPGTDSVWDLVATYSWVPENWSNSGTYAAGDSVIYNGSVWYTNSANNPMSPSVPNGWSNWGSGVSDSTGNDGRNCMALSWSSSQSGGTPDCTAEENESDATMVDFDCTFNQWYFATPRSGADKWTVRISVTDKSNGTDTDATTGFRIASYTQASFTTLSSENGGALSLGSASPGSYTGGASFRIQNEGNVSLASITAQTTALNCSEQVNASLVSRGSIPQVNLKVATSTSGIPGNWSLSTAGTNFALNSAVPTRATSPVRGAYASSTTDYSTPFQVGALIPDGVAGTCTGTLTFTMLEN